MQKLFGIPITLALVVAAVAVGHSQWTYYMDEPWTRDAKVLADVVGLAPDVSGIVSEVLVHDNQPVRAGDLLFRVDPARFHIAVEQAEAVVAGRKATLDQATRDRARYDELKDAATQQKKEQMRAAESEATASYKQAIADLALARLNLERSDVKAPVDGVVTNSTMRRGDYVTAGHAQLALVDTGTMHVEGYFEETKLAHIQVGSPVSIRLMGQTAVLSGKVESIAAGIEDRERAAAGTGLLANVNPTFNWVRLAQRVPVRIAFGEVPEGTRLIAGLTATVAVEP